jgi:hypothetical protein
LLCAAGARQKQENARQSLYCVYSIGAHDKERMVDFCTVKSHCRAPSLTTHGELSLSCVTGRRTAKKKAVHGARRKRRVMAYAVHGLARISALMVGTQQDHKN